MKEKSLRAKLHGSGRTSLAGRLTAFVTAVALFIGLVSVLLIYGASRHKAETKAGEHAAELIIRYAPQAAEALGTGDLRSLDASGAALSAHQSVLSVTIWDRQQRPVSHVGDLLDIEQHRPDPALAHEQRLVRDPRGMRAYHPLVYQGEMVGTLDLLFDRNALTGIKLGELLPILLVMLAAIAISAPLTRLFAERLTAPLQELIRVARDVAAHRFHSQVVVRSNDEFATLGLAMNEMIRRIESSMKRIQKMAYVDPVTQLPNQERFMQELRTHAAREDVPLGAVLIIHLDRLPRIIETLGEEAGAELILAAANRLTSSARAVDAVVRPSRYKEQPLTVARLKQAEFALLAPYFDQAEEASRFAQMLVTALNQPFDWREHKLALAAACGVALMPNDGNDAEELMRVAQLAASAARGSQPPLRFFTKSLDRKAISQLTLEREIRAGIEANEFRAFFQPKVELSSGRIFGAEALARWVRGDAQQIGPAKFIPAAEEFGLIGEISDAIMRDTVAKAAAWVREGSAVQIAVNVSPLQFRDDRFGVKVLRLLEQAGLPAFCLELEITEGIALEDPARALKLIQPLRERGVRIAIDDFGVGHSSLSALTRLPFDVVKIDREFVSGLPAERHAAAITETIIAMSKSLSLDVVAEGIETEEQAAFLRHAGAQYGQGYLFGAAMPSEEFFERVRISAAQVA
jgi:diguanylate cyclase (GGDEF)-like protein